MSTTIKLPYDLHKLRPRPPWPLQRLKACLCLCHGARKLRRLEENLVTSGDAWVWKWMTPPSIVFSGRWSSTNRSWGTIFSDNPASFSHLWLTAYTHILYIHAWIYIYICPSHHCFAVALLFATPGARRWRKECRRKPKRSSISRWKWQVFIGFKGKSYNWKPRIFPWNISGGFRLFFSP